MDIEAWAGIIVAATAVIGLLLRLFHRSPSRTANQQSMAAFESPPLTSSLQDNILLEDRHNPLVSGFWHMVLLELIASTRSLTEMQDASRSEILTFGTVLAARVLQSRFAFCAFPADASKVNEVERYAIAPLAEGVIKGQLPLPLRQPHLQTLSNRGLIADVMTRRQPCMFQRGTDDPLVELGVDCAVAVPLCLADREVGMLVVCNRPIKHIGGIYAYPRFKDQPPLDYGTPDGQLLKCLAWIIEHAYEKAVDK